MLDRPFSTCCFPYVSEVIFDVLPQFVHVYMIYMMKIMTWVNEFPSSISIGFTQPPKTATVTSFALGGAFEAAHGVAGAHGTLFSHQNQAHVGGILKVSWEEHVQVRERRCEKTEMNKWHGIMYRYTMTIDEYTVPVYFRVSHLHKNVMHRETSSYQPKQNYIKEKHEPSVHQGTAYIDSLCDLKCQVLFLLFNMSSCGPRHPSRWWPKSDGWLLADLAVIVWFTNGLLSWFITILSWCTMTNDFVHDLSLICPLLIHVWNLKLRRGSTNGHRLQTLCIYPVVWIPASKNWEDDGVVVFQKICTTSSRQRSYWNIDVTSVTSLWAEHGTSFSVSPNSKTKSKLAFLFLQFSTLFLKNNTFFNPFFISLYQQILTYNEWPMPTCCSPGRPSSLPSSASARSGRSARWCRPWWSAARRSWAAPGWRCPERIPRRSHRRPRGLGQVGLKGPNPKKISWNLRLQYVAITVLHFFQNRKSILDDLGFGSWFTVLFPFLN